MDAKVVKMQHPWFRKRPYLVMYQGGAFGTFGTVRAAAQAVALVRENPSVFATTVGVNS